jgi:rhomboid domain-containing protein 1
MDRGGTVGQYSLSTRAADWYHSVTLATRFITFVCVSLYLYGLLFGYNLSLVCMQPFAVANNWHKVYTFITSGFFHFSFMHILFNMISFYPMGSALERTSGSLPFLYLTLLFDVVGSLVHFLLAYITYASGIYTGFFYSCSAGFSGVIFTIITIECHNDGSRSFFGIAFPSRLYPWVTLFLVQLLFGNVSFLGHLSGILVGYMYVYKILELLIAGKLLNWLEGVRWLGRVVSMNGYITNPNFRSLPTTVNQDTGTTRWQMPSFNWFSSSQQVFPGPGRVLGSNLHATPTLPTLEKSDTQPT